MSILNSNKKWTSGKIKCLLFGHKLIIKKNITPKISEFECTNCHLELTQDEKGKKTSLTPHLREVNETLYHFHKRRHNAII
jgi:hypothetical protein